MFLELKLFFFDRSSYHLIQMLKHSKANFSFIDVVREEENSDLVRAVIMTNDEEYLDKFVEFDENSDRENLGGPEEK